MKSTLGLAPLVAALSLLLQPTAADAAVTAHSLSSNAVNYCQAFTPGPSNTIRNRVIGLENIGAPMAVACNFASLHNGAAGITSPRTLEIHFSNANTSGTLVVSCTLLTSFRGSPGAYAVTKTTAPIAPGQDRSLTWTQADNPTPGAVDLGSPLVGVNCTLPTGATIDDTYLFWNQDNGVGT